MIQQITITGIAATTPRHLVTAEGLPITSFRLAASTRRFDRASKEWVDGDTNWYTVICFRQLATNAAASIEKGQHLIVTGALRLREWETDDRTGIAVELEAETLGHDLTYGTAEFKQPIPTVERSQARAEPHQDLDPTTTEPTRGI